MGAFGYDIDGSTVVKGIDMGAVLLWLLRGRRGPGWCVLLLIYPLTQWLEQPLVQAVRGCRALSAYGSFLMNFLISVELLLALFALGKLNFSPFALVSFSCSGVWVSPVEHSVLDFSGGPACTALGSTVDTFSSRGSGKFLHIFYVAVNSNPGAFGLHSCRMEKRAQSMLLVVASLSSVRTLEVEHYFYERSHFLSPR